MTRAILATMTTSEAQVVIHCDTEEEYYKALDNAGSKLVVVDCFAEWYVQIRAHSEDIPNSRPPCIIVRY